MWCFSHRSTRSLPRPRERKFRLEFSRHVKEGTEQANVDRLGYLIIACPPVKIFVQTIQVHCDAVSSFSDISHCQSPSYSPLPNYRKTHFNRQPQWLVFPADSFTTDVLYLNPSEVELVQFAGYWYKLDPHVDKIHPMLVRHSIIQILY
jgi:hypothetical protein